MSNRSTTEYGNSQLDEGGLCLLSLGTDGAGVRGLSTLTVLDQLMTKLKLERSSLSQAVKPCDIFELIGGTSSGGLIAIMLGRLEMDVEECLDEFTKLQQTVWEGRRGGRFRNEDLKTALVRILEARGLPEYEPFDDGKDRHCKVFVCATSYEITKSVLLKSYTIPGERKQRITVLDAALATSAATTFFEPVRIGARKYVHGTLGANNPIKQLWTAAMDIWSPENSYLERSVKCLISLGSGNPGLKAVNDNDMPRTLMELATETENTAKYFVSEHRGLYDSKRYFRFNVEQGIQDVGLNEYESMGLILAATDEYLGSQEQKNQIRDCAKNLALKTRRMCPEFEIRMGIDRNNGLFDAVRKGSIVDIQKMLDLGASITAKDGSGSTVLHVAAAEGHIEALKFLLTRGADRDEKNSSGHVPAQVARMYGHALLANMMHRRLI